MEEEGYAPNRSVACEQARRDVYEAERRLHDVLQIEYPRNAAVRVVHHRGEYTGIVVGWDSIGCRVEVENDATGARKKWWSRHVELLSPNA